MFLPSTVYKLRSLIAIAALFTLQSTASAIEEAGVQYEDSIDLRGSKLQLNGAGIRYKAIFKVYTAGPYLGKLFTHGVEDNIPRADAMRIIPAMLRMSQIFSEYKTHKTGDVFTIDWTPGLDTVITIKGKTYGKPFKEPEFFNALTSIWPGKSPADGQLKKPLLGQTTS